LFFRTPLWVRVIIGVVAGALMGVIFKNEPILPRIGNWQPSLTNDHLGQMGILIVKLLRALAIPLIFFAILDALVKTSIPLRRGARLITICLINVMVAMGIGLLIMNLFEPGKAWLGHLDQMLASVEVDQKAAQQNIETSKKGTLGFIANFSGYIPSSILSAFSENNVITVVLLALFMGAAYRRIRARTGNVILGEIIEAFYRIFIQMLEWVVEMIPFAVLLVVAQVVGKSGLGVFEHLWLFLVVMLAGMMIHSLVYYPAIAWIFGRKSPREYLGKGLDPIITSLSCNSSLATVPVTLRALDRMNVSPHSSRLGVCVGTQLNNDGITLYEAMAALFLAQALGMDLPWGKQMVIVLSSIMAGAGIAGIPEAGMIVLPLVLGAAGFTDQQIAAILPLIMTVDWILARVRSAVNVLSDMVVSILLDVGEKSVPATELEVAREAVTTL
jgi:Na+/H+-dicarboxylate symporter